MIVGSQGGLPFRGNDEYTHTIAMHVPRASTCLFVIGVTQMSPFDMGIAFPALSFCQWHTSFDIQIPVTVPSSGQLIVPGSVPNILGLAGAHVDTQALGFNGLGQHQSNAMSHVLGIAR